MYDILYKSRQDLPVEILYQIISYVPFNGITPNILKLQKQRIHLYKFIRKNLLIIDPQIKRDIFANYNGETIYTYENEHTFLFIKICHLKRVLDDFFSIHF